MNYPVWELGTYGGGLLIALIATVHVYLSHFAVGGGLFLVLTEMKAYREQDQDILEYTRRHTRFFLLVTMVLGALTGVGIWLVISVVNPEATSLLIHTFVFAWGTEWVFFLVEIVSLLVYYYTFGRMERRRHLAVGWIYFGAAWLSLFVIGAIVAFMLSPGAWLQDRSFWSGWFNPTFLPSLLFRTCLALILAGVYGLITASFLKEPELRQRLVRYCSAWLLLPFIVLVPAGWWYLESIPPLAQAMVLGRSPDLAAFVRSFLWAGPLVVVAGLVIMARLPRPVQQGLALFILLAAFVHMGSFEAVRESARRPYVINGYLYSNRVLKSRLPRLQEQGLLSRARWVRVRGTAPAQRRLAGREIFRLACSSCHSRGGVRNDIIPLVRRLDSQGLRQVLARMGTSPLQYMPPFPGNRRERALLAAYLERRFSGQGSD